MLDHAELVGAEKRPKTCDVDLRSSQIAEPDVQREEAPVVGSQDAELSASSACLKYRAYDPGKARQGTLIAVHGITRQYTEQFDRLLQVARALDLRLVAPCFSETGFPDYQRLGRTGRGLRSDRALIDLFDILEIDPDEPVFIEGFSGGAQFAHRFMFAWPERVQGAVFISAGFYTMLDAYKRYPYGIRTGQKLPGVRMQPGNFLKVPTLTIVGGDDVKRDKYLRQSLSLDERQGKNRKERAITWHREMAAHASSLFDSESPHQFLLVENVAHDFSGIMDASAVEMTAFFSDCLNRCHNQSAGKKP